MMEVHVEQKNLFSYGVDLDKRVRSDNPLRKIAEVIDFSFVREEVRDLYGHNGNESIDPEIILKLMFLLFLENVKSERELIRIVPERLDYLWFLGYGLDDEVPNHSVLSKARNRWGREIFEEFFVRSVQQCVEAGLVGGEKIHVDGSVIVAEALGAIYPDVSIGRLSRLDSMQMQQMALGMQTRMREEIKQLKEALQRIDPGRYGTCELCRKDIPMERLDFQLDATVCMDCLQKAKRR